MKDDAIAIILSFDISTENIKEYTKFRKSIKEEGFMMLQYSVYYRICENRSKANLHIRRIKEKILKSHNILLFTMSIEQFRKIEIYKNGVLATEKHGWNTFEII